MANRPVLGRQTDFPGTTTTRDVALHEQLETDGQLIKRMWSYRRIIFDLSTGNNAVSETDATMLMLCRKEVVSWCRRSGEEECIWPESAVATVPLPPLRLTRTTSAVPLPRQKRWHRRQEEACTVAATGLKPPPSPAPSRREGRSSRLAFRWPTSASALRPPPLGAVPARNRARPRNARPAPAATTRRPRAAYARPWPARRLPREREMFFNAETVPYRSVNELKC